MAIEFAIQAKIDGVNVRVLSNSWGGGGFSKALLDEINWANENDILFVAAAGNDGANNDIYAALSVELRHAEHDLRRGHRQSRQTACFSNYGATPSTSALPA